MQKLFELKIFRTDEPYELIFTDEFNASINITRIHFNVTFIPPSDYKYFHKCVYHHLYHEVDGNEEHELIEKVTDVLLNLNRAGLLKNARKNVTKADIKKTEEKTDQALEEMYSRVGAA